MNNHGFARRDLLALIVAAVFGGALLYGAMVPHRRSAQASDMLNNGKQIYTSLFAQENDCPLGLSGSFIITWPRFRPERLAQDYADSTDFFAALVR